MLQALLGCIHHSTHTINQLGKHPENTFAFNIWNRCKRILLREQCSKYGTVSKWHGNNHWQPCYLTCSEQPQGQHQGLSPVCRRSSEGSWGQCQGRREHRGQASLSGGSGRPSSGAEGRLLGPKTSHHQVTCTLHTALHMICNKTTIKNLLTFE